MITIDEKGLVEAQKLLADMPKAVPKAAARDKPAPGKARMRASSRH